MPRSEAKPIACTLTTNDFDSRLAWIAELTRDALREHRRDDLVLQLTYAPEAACRVREMVRREQQCCAFLGFELNEDENGLRLVITAPEAVRDALDAVFDPFLTGSNSSGGTCACTTAAQ